MELPYWAWAGIIGGVGGALGALAGWLVERAGLKWGRWFSIAGIVGGLYLARDDGFMTRLQMLFVSNNQVEQKLHEVSPELYGYLEQSFPDDYQRILKETSDAMRTANAEGVVERRSAEIMQELRRKYASFLRLAADRELAALIGTQVDFYDLLFKDDPALCAQVAVYGPMSTLGTGFSQKYAQAMVSQTVALFKAARSGIDAPVARRQASDADWEAIGVIMAANGASEAYFSAISVLDATNLETCPAVVSMLKAMNDLSEPAQMVRASYVAEVAAS